jgi:hypothetical protein
MRRITREQVLDKPNATQAQAKRNAKTLKAALAYAAKGIPVFPCRLDKSPYTPHGLYDASSDRSRVDAWWKRYPGALIGMPTGSRSGRAVLDRDRCTPASMRIWNSLPPTLTSKTGRQSGEGRHAFLAVPKGVRVRSRDLAGSALRLQGDGCYVILPPSPHEDGGEYEWVEETKQHGIADLPAEYLCADLDNTKVTKPRQSGHRRRGGDHRPPGGGGPIAVGSRNTTLCSIGGWLRATGAEHDEILLELLTINEQRCEPPLDEREVRGIARSVARYEKGNYKPPPTPKVASVLDAIEREMWESHWRAKSERDIIIALLTIARRSGRMASEGDGIEVSISYRALALAAATSKRTLTTRISNLIASGWLRKGENPSVRRSGTLVLLGRAKVAHSNQRKLEGREEAPRNRSGEVLRAPFSAPRLRASCTLPVMRKGRRIDTITIRRLGKSCGLIVDFLEMRGGAASLDEVCDALWTGRKRDVRRRHVARLVDRGIATLAGETLSLVADWLEVLDKERDATGEKHSHRRDKARFARERRAYARRHRVKTQHAPSYPEMARMRRPELLSSLQELPDPRPEVLVAVAEFLRRWPNRDRERPSWIANTMWAHDLLGFKAPPEEVESALSTLLKGTRARGGPLT